MLKNYEEEEEFQSESPDMQLMRWVDIRLYSDFLDLKILIFMLNVTYIITYYYVRAVT